MIGEQAINERTIQEQTVIEPKICEQTIDNQTRNALPLACRPQPLSAPLPLFTDPRSTTHGSRFFYSLFPNPWSLFLPHPPYFRPHPPIRRDPPPHAVL